MIDKRELTMDDYLAMLRRRLKVIVIPALLVPVAGFLVSYLFSPKYTSQSLVLVEQQKVAEGYVAPVVTQDLSNRITTLEQRAVSAERLRPLVENLKLVQASGVEAKMDEIRQNISIKPMQAITLPALGGGPKHPAQAPGFNLNCTSSNPREAQAVCAGLTDIMLQENLRERAQTAQNTTDFLARQVEEDKRKLDEMDSRLADFKKHYIGQLPGDADNNMKLLMGMNSQLDANTQALNRAQQDKSYTESLLAQQISAWKSSQSNTNPQTLQKQLSDLQAQLLTLKARYTDDYPEVVKTKKDIQELEKKIDEMNSAASTPADIAAKSSVAEPPEIQQLRMQLHQYQDAILQATRNQQRLEDQIKLYQGRVALSPAVEEQYKQLTRDYETLQKVYDDDLAKKRASEKQGALELEQQGEQMRVLNPADLPDMPSFPNRLLFAAGGLGGGLALGLGLALWLELRDKSVRTEADVLAVLELPVLSQVPWVGEGGERNGRAPGAARAGSRRSVKGRKQTVEV
ncbi:MAG: lipopolysaccharide biosynthesis protein [Acidobacteria bacterium]|nr:lipopolysaccharide biosynthesis protein [Acidobacteriota bacterium]